MRALLPLLLAGCAAPDPGEGFSRLSVFEADSAEAAAAPFVAAIDAAELTVDAAIPGDEDGAVSQALIDAWDRGVDVRVSTDFDAAAEPGIVALAEAGVPLRLADAGLTYFEFNLNDEVTFDSTQTTMSHAMVVVDKGRVVNASAVGREGEGWRVVMDMTGQDLGDDAWAEAHQIFGGADCTAVTAYDNLAKSIADGRWIYETDQDVMLEVWFGPQERLVKRVIDAIYSARTSIRLSSDDITVEPIAMALQEKHEAGLDVQVVVGPRFGDDYAPLTRAVEGGMPDVPLLQVGDDVVPTLLLVDYEENDHGDRDMARAMVLTHPLWSTARLYRSEPVTNDQLVDGALWQLDDWDQPSEPLLAVERVWDDLASRAEEMR